MIDDAVFDRLLADLGTEHIAGVCRMFVTNTDSGINAVSVAIATGDVAGLADVTHRLKSSSGFVGARRIVALCADIEVRARAGLVGTDGLGGTGVVGVLAGELALASAELVRRVGTAVAPERPGS